VLVEKKVEVIDIKTYVSFKRPSDSSSNLANAMFWLSTTLSSLVSTAETLVPRRVVWFTAKFVSVGSSIAIFEDSNKYRTNLANEVNMSILGWRVLQICLLIG
jgi:hypothetical protein